jgi:hypothetical protein
METSVQVDGGDLIHGGGGTDIPASALSWRLHGTIDPWTAVTTTGVATAPDLEPGTPSVELDMRMDVPPGADAGSYSSVLHISVVAVV